MAGGATRSAQAAQLTSLAEILILSYAQKKDPLMQLSTKTPNGLGCTGEIRIREACSRFGIPSKGGIPKLPVRYRMGKAMKGSKRL